MSEYETLAAFYDEYMQEVDYDRLAEYIAELFKQFGVMPHTVLDAACGTGSLTAILAAKGIEMIGVDQSEEMLAAAREKCVGLDVLLLCQDLCDLDLYGTVEGAVCTLDGLNHILDKRALRRALKRICLFLEPGGCFVFDVNTLYKHEKVLGNNIFTEESDDCYFVWQNRFDKKSGIVDMSLDFFEKTGDVYRRRTDWISERAYARGDLDKILKETGFEIKAVYDFMTMKPPGKYSQKLTYVVQKGIGACQN